MWEAILVKTSTSINLLSPCYRMVTQLSLKHFGNPLWTTWAFAIVLDFPLGKNGKDGQRFPRQEWWWRWWWCMIIITDHNIKPIVIQDSKKLICPKYYPRNFTFSIPLITTNLGEEHFPILNMKKLKYKVTVKHRTNKDWFEWLDFLYSVLPPLKSINLFLTYEWSTIQWVAYMH